MRRAESTVDGDPTVAGFERTVGVCDRCKARRRPGERRRIEGVPHSPADVGGS